MGKQHPGKTGDVFILGDDPHLNTCTVLCQLIGRDLAENLLVEIMPYLNLAALVEICIYPVLIGANKGLRKIIQDNLPPFQVRTSSGESFGGAPDTMAHSSPQR
ncbi:hypothetical protein VU03_04675 [Desulfobulbus sp. N3]|nr:hypothetical protein [Desulfobulbus sp. N3]